LIVQCLHDADGIAELEFAVRDTGSGISTEQVARIFEPFTQADSTISRRHGGTGLGLAISLRLAELMGGHLQVESVQGCGTTFFLRLPLETSAGSISETITVPPIQIDPHFATAYPLRVLVVEDDKVSQKLMVMTLRKLGYQPFVADNGEEALQIAAEEGLDCIFMDVQMPVLDGITAAKEIRSREKATSIHPTFICALTANILPEDRARGLAVGMNHYTHKPVKIREIAEVMKMAAQFARGRWATK
jgi:CheY-like chemotaxis protein